MGRSPLPNPLPLLQIRRGNPLLPTKQLSKRRSKHIRLRHVPAHATPRPSILTHPLCLLLKHHNSRSSKPTIHLPTPSKQHSRTTRLPSPHLRLPPPRHGNLHLRLPLVRLPPPRNRHPLRRIHRRVLRILLLPVLSYAYSTRVGVVVGCQIEE